MANAKREITTRLHIRSAAAISLFVRSTGFLLVYIRPTPDRHGNARRCINCQTFGNTLVFQQYRFNEIHLLHNGINILGKEIGEA